MPAQDLLTLGYNVAEFDKQTSHVIEGLNKVIATAEKVDSTIINLSNFSGGVKDFKQASEELNKSQTTLAKTTQDYNKALLDNEKLRKAIAQAEKAEANAQREQIKLTQDQNKEIERQNQLKKQNANVPFTSNLNADGSVQQPAQGNTTGATVSAEELANTEAQLAAQAELNQEKKESAAIDTQAAAASKIYTTALEQEVAALLEDEAALAANKAAQKSLQEAILANGSATALQTEEMVALKTEQFALNQSISNTRSNVKNLTKDFLSSEGSIDELRTQVYALTKQYEALSVAERESQFGVNLKTQINTLQPALLKAEGELGKFQRNVGNYPKGIQKVFQSAFSNIRQLANILPGIGLAGLFGLAFEGIAKLTQALLKGRDALDEVAEKEREVNEAFQDTSLKSTVEEIEKLKVAVSSAKDGLIDKEKVVKEYNETLGATLGTAKDFNEVEDKMSDEKRLNAYVKAMLYRAAANLALSKAAEAALKAEEDRRKSEQEFNTVGSRLSTFSAGQTSAPGFVPGQNDVGQQFAARAKAAKTAQDEAVKANEDAAKKQEDIAKSFFTDIDKLTKEFNLNFNPLGKDKETKDKVKKTVDVAYETAKIEIERKIKDLQDFVNNGSILFDERNTAAEELKNTQIQLLDVVKEHEIKNGKDRVLAEKEAGDKIKDINKELAANLDKIFKESKLNLFADPEILAPVDNSEAEKQKQLATAKRINEEITKGVLDAGKDRANIIAAQQADANTKLNDLYAQGLISDEAYEKGKRDNAIKYGREAAEAAIHNAETLLTLAKQQDPNSDKVRDLTAQIAKLKETLSEFDVTVGKNAFKDLSDQLQEIADVTANLTQAFTDLASISFDNQKAELEEVGAQQEKNYEAEVQNINDSTLSQEEKADKLKILEAQHAAQQEENARKQREADNKKAEFDKAAAILNIITGTAAAVIKALPNIPLAIAVGVVGAAQLAKALATKIPHYKEGTGSAKEGWALTDEVGKELYIEPSGNMFLGNDSPTYRYLKAGTKVIPNDEVNEILHRAMMSNTGRVIRNKSEGVKDSFNYDKLGSIISKNMKNQKRPYVKVINNIGNDLAKQDYIRRNLL